MERKEEPRSLHSLPISEKIGLYDKAMELRESKGWGWRKISKELGIRGAAVKNWLYRNKNPKNKYNTPDLTPSPELSYVIGTVLSDGYTTKVQGNKRIVLSVKDREFAEEFNRNIAPVLNKEKEYNISKTDRPRYIVQATSEILFDFLNHPLNKLIEVSDEYSSHFLRGLYDGDGGTDKNWVVSLTDPRLELLQYTKMRLESYGIKTRKISKVAKKGTIGGQFDDRLVKRKKDCFQLRFAGYKNLVIFSEKVGFSIPRKSKALEKAKEGHIRET